MATTKKTATKTAKVTFRANDWYNEKSGKVRFGVQAKVDGKWLNVGHTTKLGFVPKFFRNDETRQKWLNKANEKTTVDA